MNQQHITANGHRRVQGGERSATGAADGSAKSSDAHGHDAAADAAHHDGAGTYDRPGRRL